MSETITILLNFHASQRRKSRVHNRRLECDTREVLNTVYRHSNIGDCDIRRSRHHEESPNPTSCLRPVQKQPCGQSNLTGIQTYRLRATNITLCPSKQTPNTTAPPEPAPPASPPSKPPPPPSSRGSTPSPQLTTAPTTSSPLASTAPGGL